MANEILKAFHETTEQLLQTIALFTQEQFNTIPFEDSWTAAQVTEHVYKAESAMPGILQGNTRSTERATDANVDVIKNIFLNFSTKLKSPEFILPSNADIVQDKEERYKAIKANREAIERLAGTVDLSLTYTAFALPNIGELTGIEWLVFHASHSTRHIHQLKNIYKALL